MRHDGQTALAADAAFCLVPSAAKYDALDFSVKPERRLLRLRKGNGPFLETCVRHTML